MNQFTFSRSMGLCIATATLLGAFLTGGCGSSDGATEQSPIGEAEEALRARLLCDGPLHRSCAKGQYCNSIAAGRCPGPRQFGMCAAQPQICPDIFKPVCGCDDQTYPNSCNAAAAGVAVAHDGACPPPKTVACGGIAARPCPGAGKCVDDPSDDCDPANGGADCGGICTCIETQLCIRGDHFDSDPAVCACVPDNPPETVACGGIAARPCPGAGKCVDDPSDDCDPANGGADCGGICTCIETQLCIRGDHFDSDPAVCACVPDNPPDKCAAVSCLTGQVCCPACGKCQPQGLACSQTGCTI